MRKTVKKKLSCGLLVTLGVLLAAPSADAINRKQYKHNWHRNSWSAGLMFDTHPDDEEYHSTTLTIKKQYSKHHAWRLNLTGMQRELEWDNRRVFDGTHYSWEFIPHREIGLDGGAISFQQMMFPSGNRDGVAFYWAVGPRLSALSADDDVYLTFYDDPLLGGADYVEFDEVTRFGVGVAGSVGMEWFLGRSVSLLGEFGVNIEKRWYLARLDYYDDEGRHWSDTDVFDDDVVVESPWFNLGFAVHF